MTPALCRLCTAPLTESFCDLGMSPLANSFPSKDDLARSESFYPLHAYVCTSCHLVQLPQLETPQNIFSEYAYFSSYADGWVSHCRKFADSVVNRFGLNSKHHVVEIASNDGCLLENFKRHNVRILGVDPAANIAQVAIERGIPTRVEFFGSQAAKAMVTDGATADFLIANNVLAHVPDLNDFVSGLAVLLKPAGILSIEFPSLQKLIEEVQFDTIYHEHFSYFSLLTAERVLVKHGLSVFDVEDLGTHGGSLRVYAQHASSARQPVSGRVENVRERERRAGLGERAAYDQFGNRARERKLELLAFLIEAKRAGKRFAGYGAPAKSNTLLNYCGIGRDFLDYTVDRNPHKQGRYLPGTHVPIHHPDRIKETRPDYVLVLPWNWQEEIIAELAYIRDWGGRFVIPVPKVGVIA